MLTMHIIVLREKAKIVMILVRQNFVYEFNIFENCLQLLHRTSVKDLCLRWTNEETSNKSRFIDSFVIKVKPRKGIQKS